MTGSLKVLFTYYNKQGNIRTERVVYNVLKYYVQWTRKHNASINSFIIIAFMRLSIEI